MKRKMKKVLPKRKINYPAVIIAVVGVILAVVIGYEVVQVNSLSNQAEAWVSDYSGCVVNGFTWRENQKGNNKCYHGRKLSGRCLWGRAAMYLKTEAECRERCVKKDGTWVADRTNKKTKCK